MRLCRVYFYTVPKNHREIKETPGLFPGVFFIAELPDSKAMITGNYKASHLNGGDRIFDA